MVVFNYALDLERTVRASVGAGGYIEFYMIELIENENIEMPGF